MAARLEIISKQFVSEVLNYSSQYGRNGSISYTTQNLLGGESSRPCYGDSTRSFSFRSYGSMVNPFNQIPKRIGECQKANDFIEVQFTDDVYPINVTLCETYNPGALVRILGYHAEEESWKTLWFGYAKQHIKKDVFLFSPPLKQCNFKINRIVLEFDHSQWDNYYQLQNISLLGSKVFNFTRLIGKIQSNSEDKSEPVQNQEFDYFSLIPVDLYRLIFSYLDLVSLCRVSQVCKNFKQFACDKSLYRDLNLQPYWTQVTDEMLETLSVKCRKDVRWLNLCWCRSLSYYGLLKFLKGMKNLRTLRLDNCTFMNHELLQNITEELPSLYELSLGSCQQTSLSTGLRFISDLKYLKCLNLYATKIDDEALSFILRSCVLLEHLNLGGCSSLQALDQVFLNIPKNSFLKTLDLWRAQSLTSNGIFTLINRCPKLEDLDLGWCLNIDASSLCIEELACYRSVQLKRFILTSIRSLRDSDVDVLSFFCTNLEQLDISGTREIQPESVLKILNNCRNLKLLDVSFSSNIDPQLVDIWQRRYPKVQIKMCLATLI